MTDKTCMMGFSAVHPDDVNKFISNLSNSTSFGLDELDTYIIKLIKDQITPTLTHIINLSLKTQVYPEQWKDSKVIPLHKKDDMLNPKNYRPVAIIPILSKVMERAVFQQTMTYLVNNSLLNPSHHAYRSNHSTTTAMIEMMDTWTQAVDSGEMAGVCMLDMSAAFDVVDHDILLQKMSVYGFSRNMVSWFCSYL